MFHGLQIGNHHVKGIMEYVCCVSMMGHAINIFLINIKLSSVMEIESEMLDIQLLFLKH